MTAARVAGIIFLFVFYLVLTPPASGQTKQKTPLEGLQSIPFPPKTIQEALRRCPIDRDTLVHSLAEDLDYYISEKEIELDKPTSNDPDGYNWRQRLLESKRGQSQAQEKLNMQIQKDESDVARMQVRVVDSPAHRLVEEVRLIGEELDSKIKNCPAGKAGYDTLCVESAEAEALNKRRDASSNFLREVNVAWSPWLDSLKIIMTTRLELTRKISPREYQKQTIQLWKIVRMVLEKEEQITKLAVQFSR